MSETAKHKDYSFMLKSMLTSAVSASWAEVCTIPIDCSKVRLQNQQIPPGGKPKYTSMLQTIGTVAREEGARSLYRGLTPGMQRQFINCSIRFGLYEPVRDFICPGLKPGEPVPLLKKIMAATITGTISICFANPTDVVKVRSQYYAQTLPADEIPLTRTIY